MGDLLEDIICCAGFVALCLTGLGYYLLSYLPWLVSFFVIYEHFIK